MKEVAPFESDVQFVIFPQSNHQKLFPQGGGAGVIIKSLHVAFIYRIYITKLCRIENELDLQDVLIFKIGYFYMWSL